MLHITETTLLGKLYTARRKYAVCGDVVRDAGTEGFDYDSFVAHSFVFSRFIGRALSRDEKSVGLMLPTGVFTMMCFFALHHLGRVPAMMNFNAGLGALLGACKTIGLSSIVTSRAFIEKVHMNALVEAIENTGVRILYLEDLAAQGRATKRLWYVLARYAPRLSFRLAPKRKALDPAVILLTSGSEGAPKGVALSHANIIANVNQFTERLDLGPHDRMFCCLPLYHSFGLTVGAILPLMTGMQCCYYPSPLHYHEVPAAIRESKPTIFLTTDTFLTGYARAADKDDFASLRYIVAGAETLKESTRRIWLEKFGKVLYEGYGVTETSPVICVNTPAAFKEGSAGRVLDMMDYKIEPVEGIKEGGALWVRGPNVMLGYIKADAPGVIKPLEDGWHNTGDIAHVDEDGFITLLGRLKRFAKIGGEMVSLVSVEQAVARVWPGTLHAVVSVPHARKGEALVLLTENEEATFEGLLEGLKETGQGDVAVPRQLFHVDKIPVLGPGKIDHISARALALRLVEEAAAAPEAEEGGAAEKPLSVAQA